MKIIIHVGPHKTGSTAIQEMCIVNADILLAQGILFKWKIDTLSSNHELVEAIQNRESEKLVLIFGYLRKKLVDKCISNVLFSSENFSLFSKSDIIYLKNIISPFDIEVMYVQRSPLLQIYSWWQETVKHGATHDLNRFVMKVFLGDGGNDIFQPTKILDNWESVIGREHIKCLKYKEGFDIFDQFIKYGLGLNISGLRGVSANINKSFTPIETEILRIKNSQGINGVIHMLQNELLPLRKQLNEWHVKNSESYHYKAQGVLLAEMELINRSWITLFKNIYPSELPIDKFDVDIPIINADLFFQKNDLMREVREIFDL
jgi:hypothetical protein